MSHRAEGVEIVADIIREQRALPSARMQPLFAGTTLANMLLSERERLSLETSRIMHLWLAIRPESWVGFVAVAKNWRLWKTWRSVRFVSETMKM